MSVMWRRLWIQITADRRRFGLLCTTMVVGLLLWARLIVVSNLPRTAVADQESTAAKAQSTTNPSGKGAAAPGAGGSGNGGRKAGEKIQVLLDQQPVRDPFVINPVHFPKPEPPPVLTKEAGKLEVEQADPLQELAKRTSRLLELASQLRLEAVMGGSMAAISGKAVSVGGAVPVGDKTEQIDFKLVEVKQRSVILECEGRRFELEMGPPQQ